MTAMPGMDSLPDMDAASGAIMKRDLVTLALLAGLFLILCLIIVGISPPHEGDSSEYASIARSLLSHGTLSENFIKDYVRRDFSLPHPASSRSAFMPFLLVPFVLLFKTSIYSMAVPGALAWFCVPLLTYLTGYHRFGRTVSFWAAVLALFSVQIAVIFLVHEPCEPEMFLMPLYLATLYFFLEKRFALCGVVLGLALLTRQTSVALPAGIILFTLIYDRRRGAMVSLGKVLFVAMIVMSPLLIRNAIVFGNPVYSEQAETIPRVYNDLYGRALRGDMFASSYDYDLFNRPAPPPLAHGVMAHRMGNFLIHNIAWVLFGRMTDIGFHTGLVDSFHAVLFVFLLVGLFHAFRNRKFALFSLVFVLHFGPLLLSPVIFVRYEIPVFPIGYLLALYGMVRVFQESSRVIRVVSLFVFTTEFMSFFLIALLVFFTQARKSNYVQMGRLCAWHKTQSVPADLHLGMPYISINYLCDRPVLAFPTGDVNAMRRVARRFDPHFMIYTGEWQGDRLPLASGMIPVASNGKITLFSIDPNAMDEDKDKYLSGLNFIDYFMASRFRMELFPPLFRALRVLAARLLGGVPGSAAAAWILGGGVWLALLFLFNSGLSRGRVRLVWSATVVLLFALVSGVAFMVPSSKNFPQKTPAFSVVQLFRFLSYQERTGHAGPLRIAINKGPGFLNQFVDAHPDKDEISHVMFRLNTTGGVVFDDAMNAADYDVLIYFRKIPERLFLDKESVMKNHEDMARYLADMERLKQIPALKTRRALLMNGAMVFY